MKRYLSIILALLIALSSISAGFFVSAADQAEKYDTEAYYDLVYKGYQSQLDGPEWELATNEYYMPLDEYANQWTNDFFYGFATRITDNELTKERYTEILVQFMSLLDMSTTEMIANQVEADTTKSLRDYALDIGDILTGTITLDAAFNQEATTAMKSVATALGLTWGAADVTADSLEALQYADWLLKDYNSHALFLTAIVNNAEDSNLRNAASDLLLFSQKVFYIRMNEIDEIGESVEFYLGKDVFFDTIVLDKMCSGAGPLDISNADVKILSLFKAAYTLIENAASAGSKLGVFAADCIIGASNLINRSQEIIALNYIKKALTTEGTNLKKEICNADAHEKIRELSTIVTDLLYLNYRAFYDMHEMNVNEAQLASIVIRLNGQATEFDKVFKEYEKVVLMAINNIEDIFPDWDDFLLDQLDDSALSKGWIFGNSLTQRNPIAYLEEQLGYQNFNSEDKELCRGDFFESDNIKKLVLIYFAPQGSSIPAGSYVSIWAANSDSYTCCFNEQLSSFSNSSQSYDRVYVRIIDGHYYLNTCVRVLENGKDTSIKKYYTIDDTVSLEYDLYSESTIASEHDGIIYEVTDECYRINQADVDFETFYAKQDALDYNNIVLTLRSFMSEGEPPQGKTFDELMSAFSESPNNTPTQTSMLTEDQAIELADQFKIENHLYGEVSPDELLPDCRGQFDTPAGKYYEIPFYFFISEESRSSVWFTYYVNAETGEIIDQESFSELMNQ